MTISVQFAGLSAARAKLALLAKGLHEIADGTVVDAAVAQVQKSIDKVVRQKLSAHRMSGHAGGEVRVDAAGTMVLVAGMPPAKGKAWSGKSYLSMHGWWPFRRGMPGFVVKQASRIFAAHVLAALGSRSGAIGALAGSIADDAAASDAKAQAKALSSADKRARRAAKRAK